MMIKTTRENIEDIALRANRTTGNRFSLFEAAGKGPNSSGIGFPFWGALRKNESYPVDVVAVWDRLSLGLG